VDEVEVVVKWDRRIGWWWWWWKPRLVQAHDETLAVLVPFKFQGYRCTYM